MRGGRLRVLIVAAHYAPSAVIGAKRPSFLARELVSLGHSVEVVALRLDTTDAVDNTLPTAGTVHSVRSLVPVDASGQSFAARIYRRLLRVVLRFPDRFATWIPTAVWTGLKRHAESPLHVILASGPPFSGFVAAALLSHTTRIPLVLDYRDPWTAFDWGDTRHGRRMRSTQNVFAERWVLRHAKAVIFASESMRAAFVARFGSYLPSILEVITNGFDEPPVATSRLLERDATSMLYAGHFYGERRLRDLLESLKILEAQHAGRTPRVVVNVYGKVLQTDLARAEELGMASTIREQPRVDHAEIVRRMQDADVLFLPSGSDVSYAIPYKFFDYLSAKRPILAVTPPGSALADMMSRIDCGEVASQEPGEIARALERIWDRRGQYLYTGRDKHTWLLLGRQLEDLLQRVSPPEPAIEGA